MPSLFLPDAGAWFCFAAANQKLPPVVCSTVAVPARQHGLDGERGVIEDEAIHHAPESAGDVDPRFAEVDLR